MTLKRIVKISAIFAPVAMSALIAGNAYAAPNPVPNPAPNAPLVQTPPPGGNGPLIQTPPPKPINMDSTIQCTGKQMNGIINSTATSAMFNGFIGALGGNPVNGIAKGAEGAYNGFKDKTNGDKSCLSPGGILPQAPSNMQPKLPKLPDVNVPDISKIMPKMPNYIPGQ